MILFITSHRLGDAVISTAVLHGLIKTYPKARFTIACNPAVRDIFRNIDQVSEIISFSKKKWNGHWFLLWKEICLKKWFLIVDLRGSIIPFFVYAQKRVIFHGGRRPGLKINHQRRLFNFDETYLPVITIKQKDREKADIFLSSIKPQLGNNNKGYIAIAPTAGSEDKIWSCDKVIKLMDLFKKNGWSPILFFGPGQRERNLVAPILKDRPNLPIAGNGQALMTIAAILEKCHIFIGNDSGLMHLSAACNVMTLGLFGPTLASQYAPQGKNAYSLCAKNPFQKGRMQDISLQHVIKEINKLSKKLYAKKMIEEIYS